MRKPLILIIALLGWNITCLLAQSKVLGKPESFKKPVDYFGSDKTYDNYLLETGGKDKKDAWSVISDRADNKVYKSPSSQSQVVGTAPFRKLYFVVEEKDEWLKLVEARVSGLEIVSGTKIDIGWVPKKNLLLWTSGIVGPETRIHRKALLLNKAENIDDVLRKDNKDLVRLYSDPYQARREPERRVFEFYFVMKKEGQMMLLSESVNLTPLNIETSLVGWVNERDCDKWDTRICLEPNIEKEAFKERKENPKYRIKAFKNPEGAISYAQGSTSKEDVFWANDPVVINESQLAKSDPRRFKGSVVRFPMVDMQKTSNGTEYFLSGLIGSLPVRTKTGISSMEENQYAQLEKYLRAEEYRSKNISIYFIVEATDSVQAYQSRIASSIEAIDKEIGPSAQKVRYGALLYRGLGEREQGRMTEHIALTTDKSKVVNFIKQSKFENIVSRSEYTTMYYGLNKALSVAGFDTEDLNIVIVIGCYADFKADKITKDEAEARKDDALLDANTIAENINKLKIHLHSVQLRNEGFRASDFFGRQATNFILENAKLDYNNFLATKDEKMLKSVREYSSNISYDQPLIESTEEDNILGGGKICTGSFKRPSVGRYLEPERIPSILKKIAGDALEFTVNNKKILSKLINEGNEANLNQIAKDLGINDVGPYEGSFLTYLNDMSKDKSIDFHDVLGEKFRLFTKVYIPLNIRGASNPAISYAVFMPESDIKSYQTDIKLVSSLTELSSPDVKRERLMDAFKSLVTKFTGGKGADFKNMSSAELRDMMQGINRQGLKPQQSIEYLYKLGDIENKSKVSDDQLNGIIARFKEVEKMLENILRMGVSYEFCYASDEANRYYWIPLRDVF